MMIWLDAQLPPALAKWIETTFNQTCQPVRAVGLRDAPDNKIFERARLANIIVMTKDRDFVELLHQHGPPPQIIWLTCGNTSNQNLQSILVTRLPLALQMLQSGESLVEIQ